MLRKRSLAYTSLLLALVGCTDSKEESKSGEAATAQIEAFQSRRATATSIPEESIHFFLMNFSSELGSEHYEYESTADESGGAAIEETCFQKELLGAFTISSTLSLINVRAEFLPSEACVAEQKQQAAADVESTGFGFHLAFTRLFYDTTFVCDSDVSGVANMPKADIDISKVCAHPIGMQRSFVMEGQSTVFTKQNGQVVETTGDYVQESFMIHKEGGPCPWSYEGDTVTEKAGCVLGSFNKLSAGSGPTVRYFLGTKGAVTTAAGPHEWYDSGSMTFEVNDWDGTVTYSNRDTGPNYSMTNGTKSVAGNLDDALGIKLHAQPLHGIRSLRALLPSRP